MVKCALPWRCPNRQAHALPGASISRRAALLASWAVLAACAAGIAPPPVSAAAPCWQQVVSDWADGGIGSTYPVHCYREALARLPEDLRIYSSAEDDIRRALINPSTRRTHGAVRLLQSRSSEPKAAAPARKAGRRAAPARKVAIHVAAATTRTSTPFPFPVLLVLVSTLIALLVALCLSVWAKTRGRGPAT